MPRVPRSVLKAYFQTGDQPTQQQFGTMLDSLVNFIDDRDLIGLRTYNPAIEYIVGDCAVFNDQVVKCIAATTGVFNPAHWTVIAAFGSVNYAGTWDTQANTPALQSSVGTKGFYYVVVNASPDPNDNTELNGINDWLTGDWAIYNGSAWQRVDNSNAPVEAQFVSFEPEGNITATNVQDAIAQLDADTQSLIDVEPPYIPYAVTQNTLAESWLANAPEGIVVSLEKIIRSEPSGKSQIDFGEVGNELKLSTAGGHPVESRILLNGKEANIYAHFISAIANDGKSGIEINDEANLRIYNDAAAGTDGEINFEEGKLEISQSNHASIILDEGTDTFGRTKLSAAGNDVVITKGEIRFDAGIGSSILALGANGEAKISSGSLDLNSDTVYIDSVSASSIVITDSSQNLSASIVSLEELESLSGITSSVQDQLDEKLSITGGTMTGSLVLNSDPATALEAATKQYTDNGLNAKLNLTGGTLTGSLNLSGNPSVALEATTKQYVDAGDTALENAIDAKVNLAGDTMTGDLILNADPTVALGATTKQYTDDGLAEKVNLSGSTMTGDLILNADPTTALGAVTKQYADALDAALQFQVDGKVNLDGDTMTGDLILNADPTAALGAATKGYTDTAVGAKISRSGDTMTGNLILNANPSVALGAATKQYADAINTSLQSQVNGKVNKAGDTMTGDLILNANPTIALGAATKLYTDTAVGAKVSKAGDTMTGNLILNADPSAALGAATKQYVDGVDTALQTQVNSKVSLAGDTMTGDLILNANPTIGLGAATKQYTDAATGAKVSKAGDTMTGALILSANPTAALGAATKQYADAGDAGLQTQVNGKVNKAGDTMTGDLILNANPTIGLGAATKQYTDTATATKVSKAGDTMTGDLILNANPTAALGATTKQYTDAGDAGLQTQVNAKVNLAGDTLTGFLVLNADPLSALGAVTKQYADAIQAAASTAISAKVNRSGDTMSGNLILNADPTAALGATTKQYTDAGLGNKLNLSGGTLTGGLVLNGNPATALEAATKQYVDTAESSLQASKVSKAGDTMTGSLVLNADPASSLQAATKRYVDNGDTVKLNLAGGTMTGSLILNANPSSGLGAATKQYVDTAIAAVPAQLKAIALPITFAGAAISFTAASWSRAGTTATQLRVLVPAVGTLFPGTTTITANLVVDYATSTATTTGNIGLYDFTSGGTVAPYGNSSQPLAGTTSAGNVITTDRFTLGGGRSFEVIVLRSGAAGTIGIKSVTLLLTYA